MTRILKIKAVGYTVNVLHGDVGRKVSPDVALDGNWNWQPVPLAFFGGESMSLYQGYLFPRGGVCPHFYGISTYVIILVLLSSNLGEAVEPDKSVNI